MAGGGGGGELAARQEGAGSCGMLSACGWWRLKARSFWLFLRRRLCSAGCVLERRGFVVILAVFYVKNDRAKSVGWKFLQEAQGRWVSALLANQNGSGAGFPRAALETSASLKR